MRAPGKQLRFGCGMILLLQLLLLLYPAAAENLLEVRYGDPIDLLCKTNATGGDETAAGWKFNGTESLPGNANLKSDGGVWRLRVAAAELINEGSYECDDADVTVVSVRREPPLLKPLEEKSVLVIEGSDVRLPECEASAGHPDPETKWVGVPDDNAVVTGIERTQA